MKTIELSEHADLVQQGKVTKAFLMIDKHSHSNIIGVEWLDPWMHLLVFDQSKTGFIHISTIRDEWLAILID